MKKSSIITFYSFKGGIGRTMALANIAFLAALNRQRVLVMDWDLEAPGLIHYFRGLLTPAAIHAIKEKPGVLDLLCQWQTGVTSAPNNGAIDQLQAAFSEGIPFQQCISGLIDPALNILPTGGCLDFIGPGAPIIGHLANQPYAEALASFSWGEFFSAQAGGFMLERLCDWAKRQYDVILIDSRTGLADVAGVCTLQIPDQVALCFALNQQNIDGICQVASAARVLRGKDFPLHPMAMQVPLAESASKADAMARAISALNMAISQGGGSFETDLMALSVQRDERIPMLETLAPFFATDPAFDPLVLSYARIARKLLDIPIGTVQIPPELLTQIKSRLAPQFATPDYLQGLANAEQERARTELVQLIDGAIQELRNSKQLPDSYTSALINTAKQICGQSNEQDCLLLNKKIQELAITVFLPAGEASAIALSLADTEASTKEPEP